jgi:hypothetical protein
MSDESPFGKATAVYDSSGERPSFSRAVHGGFRGGGQGPHDRVQRWTAESRRHLFSVYAQRKFIHLGVCWSSYFGQADRFNVGFAS